MSKVWKSSTALWSIGTAVPPYRISQDQALRFMKMCYQPDEVLERRLHFIYRRSHIDFRHTCCADFVLDPARQRQRGDFYLLDEPGTERRMQEYNARVVDIAADAAQQALDRQESFRVEDITHFIVVTCTGFYAPGPDLDLMERLGLRRDVWRLQIGFMGCQAALQGLQTADAICRSDARAVVLVVCAELCTLHFQRAPTSENLIINSLFADGAAAGLLSESGRGRGAALCRLEHFASHVAPRTRDLVSWHIGDQGFRMGLALTTPGAIRRALPDFVEGLIEAAGRNVDQIDLWAVHPGGRAILDSTEKALGLDPQALSAGRDILRACGNMSSPTLLFVLEQVLQQAGEKRGIGVALSFGPGLSLEGMLWRSEAGRG